MGMDRVDVLTPAFVTKYALENDCNATTINELVDHMPLDDLILLAELSERNDDRARRAGKGSSGVRTVR